MRCASCAAATTPSPASLKTRPGYDPIVKITTVDNYRSGEKSFIDLVNADILFAGFSSFSYSAAMLRRKGVVLYCKYWHNYSKKNILVVDSKSIYENREKILLAIK